MAWRPLVSEVIPLAREGSRVPPSALDMGYNFLAMIVHAV